MEKISLLDYLSKKSNCNYISDLRVKGNASELLSVLNQINPDQYSSKEWKDVYLYISEKTSDDIESKVIKAKIIEYLK